jgi:ADP-ribose pyrophosphatase YjhB (NUDIX family)
MEADPLPWLQWVRTLQGIGQAGLTWTEGGEFDRDRYRQVEQIAAEIAAGIAGLPTQAIADAFSAETGHPTPKVDVRGGVVGPDGHVLLVRERSDGLWTLPGGWADPGDTPSATITREVREESGYAVRPTRLVAVHDRDLRNRIPLAYAVYKLFFLCELLEPEPSSDPDHEITEIGWFDPSHPPPLSLGRVVPDQLAIVARHHADPTLPTEFD